MLQAAVVVIWLMAIMLLVVMWNAARSRELAWQRLGGEAQASEIAQRPLQGRRLRRTWIWVPWVVGLIAAVGVAVLLRFSMPYVVAIGLMTGLLASQVEAFFAGQRVARLEAQLADAIDIMIGAVGAGASVGAAIDASITETRMPLRPYLEEVAGRIRLGDEPGDVFRSLAERIPLETFLLFTSALSVHWEVGGRLSSTLVTVGRTIRDRIDISRRIRSSSAQSQFSTIAILGLTYFIALVVWNNGPEQMREFVTSSIGSWFVAGSVILQAVGIVWMNAISKPRF